VEARIKQLEAHVIVCGFGRMGRLLVQRLSEENLPMVIVEKDPEARSALEKLEQLYVIGDATEEDTLERAGISKAQSLVAVLASDADNVFVTLTARQMRKDLNIVARAEQFSSIPKLRHAGANRVMSPQAIGAERIANIITRPHIVDFVDVAAKGVDLEMDEFTVSQDSPLAGKSLREANIRQTAEVMVVAIMRSDGSTTFNPAAEEVVRPQDTLITIGPAGATQRLAKMELISDEKAE
jgi:voltage-gated potassium channel